MKKISVIIFFSVILLACKDESKFTISGKFLNADPKSKAYLISHENNKKMTVDSTVLTNNGEFQFIQNTKGANFFKVLINQNEYLLIAKEGDKIDIHADLAERSRNYSITGSDESDRLQELNVKKNSYNTKIAEFEKEVSSFKEAGKKSKEAFLNEIKNSIEKENMDLMAFILKFANNNTESLAGFYAISSLNPQQYEQELIAYSDKIKSNFNNNTTVTEFLVHMAKLKTVQVGQIAPQFTIKSIEGTPVSLSDFKGQYVLLDFWASWCMPCRKENPNIVNAYHQFKDQNFTVFGISLDKNPNAWKNAVAADKLLWAQGSELKDFDSETVKLYQVESIPSSFMIDPNGKIIGKNLQGDDLLDFLTKTLSDPLKVSNRSKAL